MMLEYLSFGGVDRFDKSHDNKYPFENDTESLQTRQMWCKYIIQPYKGWLRLPLIHASVAFKVANEFG